MTPIDPDPRLSVVVLTHRRTGELLRTLHRLSALPEQPRLIVVDNDARGRSAERVAREFPQVQLVRCPRNLGAAGRNAGVERVRTPYVAFCDDDTWWAPGALRRAAELLDAHPHLGALAARVLVGPEECEDPTCRFMARSPLPGAGLPGPALIGFMAGAVVMRTEAFRAVGGYEPRLFIGGEERLMGLDLLTAGWQMAYEPGLTVHHHPSSSRDTRRRQLLHARNALWIAWLRLPGASLRHETHRVLREAADAGLLWPVLVRALVGLPWVLRHRRVVPPEVERMRQQVLGAPRRIRARPAAAGA
ncbi:glycosyltransferase [Schlegelella sp. S2-27]|uniref:Glycosyltransferase n=1 Tax=Caldimonas mangrovi TaxID=2944811 RepID=A0ABT0YW51_9BURK|nr:glycosyltransferase [Caldimonas mangrovi]MCM5682813.1 glycosyltransferase [Caldimonas mangrovi]